jgi:uncharacterized Rmd1/YagE family protein
MDCFAFCTASSYRLKPLFEMLRARYKATLYRDVIHVEYSHNNDTVDFFLFSYGAVVSWGIDKAGCLEWIKEIRAFEEQPYKEYESDVFTYFYGTQAKINEDEICLSDHDPLSKLAISYAIAQSVKLETFETSIQKTFNSTKHLPEDLATKGKIFLSRREIRKKMGQLFIQRSSINLHLDVLDTPEIFWEYPEVEWLHKMASVYLDIDTRVEILNQRLDVIHELLEMLGNELNHQHSSRLEWTIILLIIIEVVLIVSKDILKWT